jgi:hypothetical protein
MTAKARTEEFIYDIFKLAIVEAMFKHIEEFRLGAVATVIIVLLIAWKAYRRSREK